MHRRQTPHTRLVVLLAVAVVAVLGTGGAYAATRSSGQVTLRPSMPAGQSSSPAIGVPTTVPGSWPQADRSTTSTAPTGASASTATPSTSSSSTGTISYTVKPGDTLSTISEWFKLHGYQALYQANASVIGANPDLIHPGQVITIANGQMTVG